MGLSLSPKSVFLLLCLLLNSVIVESFADNVIPGSRDPYQWPFTQDSIWNMPIGTNARYVPQPINPDHIDGIQIDQETIIMTPDASLMQVYGTNWFWQQGTNPKTRCEKIDNTVLMELPIPPDFRTTFHEVKPNNSAAILLPDGQTIVQTQPFQVCEGGYATTGYRNGRITHYENVDIYGEGKWGMHGGSGLSTLGGSLRVGELSPGAGPIRHALKISFPGKYYLYYDHVKQTGYRWPARKHDSSAARKYNGTLPEAKIGCLRAIPDWIDLDDLRLETDPGRKIAWTLQNYGAYQVEGVPWARMMICTEEGPNGNVRKQFLSDWGFDLVTKDKAGNPWFRDMIKVMQHLHIVANNSPVSIGGGGTPRQPLAPPFAERAKPKSRAVKQSNKTNKPNIIYILADDLGYGDIGPYGQKDIKTPVLDRMAAEGMLFTDHYAGSTVCAPSRCSLMTGMHQGHAIIRGNVDVELRPEDTTVADLLQSAGYKTACIGKWGLGQERTGRPDKKGFDMFFGYLDQIRAHNSYTDYLWLIENGVKTKVTVENEIRLAQSSYAAGIGSAALKKNVHSHELFMQKAREFIAENHDHPFFLYLAITLPHANNEHWVVNDPHGLEAPSLGDYADKTDWPEAKKAYASLVTWIDSSIGELLRQLKTLGIDKNTLVIFTSDNGPHEEGDYKAAYFDSNGPLRGVKRDLFEGGIRVPFIARWPEKIAAGTQSDHPSVFYDFLPTVCEIAGVDIPDAIDGISYLPTLLGKANQMKHEYLYWEWYKEWESKYFQALRRGNWKGLRVVDFGHVKQADYCPELILYNLQNDTGEEHNVSHNHSKIVRQIEAMMNEAHQPDVLRYFPAIPPYSNCTPLASTPPRGWNSFDSYGVYLHEEAALANLKTMAIKPKPHGYQYFSYR